VIGPAPRRWGNLRVIIALIILSWLAIAAIIVAACRS
jgi:hypothetical protein